MYSPVAFSSVSKQPKGIVFTSTLFSKQKSILSYMTWIIEHRKMLFYVKLNVVLSPDCIFQEELDSYSILLYISFLHEGLD